MPPPRPESPARRALPWLGLALLYTAVTLVYYWPLPRLFGDHVGEYGDSLFNLYVLKWGVHQIGLGFPDFWSPTMFFPTRGTLAYSDHLLGPAFQLFLFLKVIPNAVAGYNFLFLSSYVASALAVCWVLRRSGLSWIAAALAGWMYAYSSFRLAQFPHLQILLAQWIPLTLWLWDRLLARRTAKDAALFLLFYLLNLTGGCYLAYMIHFPMLAILASRALAERRELLSFRFLRLLVPVGLVAGVGAAALFLPYVRVAHEQRLARPESEIETYSARLASYFSPSSQNLYSGGTAERLLEGVFGEAALHRPENELFAGFLPTILFFVGAIGSAVAAWRGRRSPADPWVRGLVLSGLLCFALSFAGVYVPLAKVVPGLSGMRVPARFYAFVSLTLVFFAGRGVDSLLGRISGPRARAAVAVGLALFLAVELAPRRIDWRPVPREEELPRAYSWIRDEPSVRAIVELPLRSGEENLYLYAATLHWKPIANGYSGSLADSYVGLLNNLPLLPHADGFNRLRGMGITHVVLHTGKIQPRLVRRWEERFAAGPRQLMEKVYEGEGIAVYRLIDPPAPDSAPPA
jgi:hypothetical protein